MGDHLGKPGAVGVFKTRSLFGDDIIAYQQNLKKSIMKITQTIKQFSKATGYKINIKNQQLSYKPTTKSQKIQLQGKLYLQQHETKLKFLGINLVINV